jgi:hypothetical protein
LADLFVATPRATREQLQANGRDGGIGDRSQMIRSRIIQVKNALISGESGEQR